jgi:hypothetical protein
MGKFLLLAFRNVFRNRRRTIMTLIMVGGGVTGLLLVGGFFARMFWGLRESTINDGLGHIQIFTAEHFNLHLHRGSCARRSTSHRVQRHAFQRRQIQRLHG